MSYFKYYFLSYNIYSCINPPFSQKGHAYEELNALVTIIIITNFYLYLFQLKLF